MDLILASTSMYRRTLMERLGLPFRCIASPIDEEAVKLSFGGLEPRELAGRLAMAKAEGVVRLESQATVIGADQLVAFEGQILGKPGTVEAAVAQLQAMAGKTHELITALIVIDEKRVYAHTDIARLTLRPLSIAQTQRYVEADRPLDCAGSYKLESRGITLFERIESADQSAIIGLPLIALTTVLRTIGYTIP